jgi:hypothetical protein
MNERALIPLLSLFGVITGPMERPLCIFTITVSRKPSSRCNGGSKAPQVRIWIDLERNNVTIALDFSTNTPYSTYREPKQNTLETIWIP